jgi:hypothetical protein
MSATTIPGITPPPKWLTDMEDATTIEAIAAALPFGDVSASAPDPSAPWNAFKTLADFDAWKSTNDPQDYIPWDDFGLVTDPRTSHLDASNTVAGVKAVISGSALRYFFDPTNPAMPAGTVVAVAQAKNAAATASDRKADITVTIPADKVVGAWVVLQIPPGNVTPETERAQAQQVAAGQTSMVFHVTYTKDAPARASIYVGRGYDGFKQVPAVTFP